MYVYICVCVDMHACSLWMQTCTTVNWARKYILVASPVAVRKQLNEASVYASQTEVHFIMAGH